MNTERRHELGENTLARELNTWGDKLRPYTSALLVVIAVMLGIYIIASLWNSYQERRDQAAWDDYQLAVFEGDVEQRAMQRLAVSEDHEGTEMQEWAMIGWADRQLLRAAQLYLINRDEANDRVTDIIGVYEQLAGNAQYPEIRNRAQLGLARAYEMKNDLKQARDHYERVEGALADIAKQRLEQLNSKQVEETANWLATVELPKPTTPPGPGTPGSRPGFEAAAPTTDPLGSAATGAATSMSELFGGLEAEDASRYEPPASGSTGNTTDESTDDAAGETPGETPAADTPAPASEATPTESTPPAAEQPAADDAGAEAPPDSASADEAEQPAPAAAAEQ